MSRVTRKKTRVSYYEPEEPSFDEYIFCTSCGDYVFEYCSIHGPLLVIPDDEVPTPTGYPPFVPRAALTIPNTFLHLAPSTIPDAGIGVFSTLTLPRGVRFGPYQGLRTDDSESPYCWQIFDRDHKPSHIMDARDANKSNWMRYVNCSRHYIEQNLVAFQYQGQLYYRTIKIIPRFTELLVFYGSQFASELNIDLRRYHSPVYMETLVKCVEEKPMNEEIHHEDPSTYDIENAAELQNSLESNSNINRDELKENDSTGCEIVQENYVCDHCSQMFTGKVIFLAHLEIHKTFKNKCSICNATFGLKSDQINHEIKVHNADIKHWACSMCDFKTVSHHLKDHIINKHGNKIYKCNLCDFETKSEVYLKRHAERHTKEAHKDKRKCGQTEKQTRKETVQMKCTICGSIQKKKNFRRHMTIHTKEKQISCTICTKKFINPHNLKRHMEIHCQEKPYICNVCEKVFSIQYNLEQHIKWHSQEKLHKCMICDKAFRKAYGLKRHMKSHAKLTMNL